MQRCPIKVTVAVLMSRNFRNVLYFIKVNWNSMIEIGFNRSVKILPNRVYRIGMVLNKVNIISQQNNEKLELIITREKKIFTIQRFICPTNFLSCYVLSCYLPILLCGYLTIFLSNYLSI